jgi:hypothetical protein
VATVMRDGSPSTPPPTGDPALRHCSASTCEFDQVGRSSPSELVDEVPDRAVGQVVITRVIDVTDHAAGTSPYYEAAKT